MVDRPRAASSWRCVGEPRRDRRPARRRSTPALDGSVRRPSGRTRAACSKWSACRSPSASSGRRSSARSRSATCSTTAGRAVQGADRRRHRVRMDGTVRASTLGPGARRRRWRRCSPTSASRASRSAATNTSALVAAARRRRSGARRDPRGDHPALAQRTDAHAGHHPGGARPASRSAPRCWPSSSATAWRARSRARWPRSPITCGTIAATGDLTRKIADQAPGRLGRRGRAHAGDDVQHADRFDRARFSAKPRSASGCRRSAGCRR